MSLSIDDKNKCGVTHNVLDATVFAVGADDRYIVAKQHPVSADQVHFDRSVTNYLIVDRMLTATLRDRKTGVIGPLTKEQFEQKAAALQLPNFTKTFPKLEW
jgi:hypothetical protein